MLYKSKIDSTWSDGQRKTERGQKKLNTKEEVGEVKEDLGYRRTQKKYLT